MVRGNKPGFLFQCENGQLLIKPRFVEAIRTDLAHTIMLYITLTQYYAGHSFRIRAATAAGACGLNDSLI